MNQNKIINDEKIEKGLVQNVGNLTIENPVAAAASHDIRAAQEHEQLHRMHDEPSADSLAHCTVQ